MKSCKINNKPILVVLFSLILSFSFISTSAYARVTYGPVVNPVSFAGKDISIYKSAVSGSSYGWKILVAFKISSPSYNEAVDNLWKNAGIPESERSKYELVNIRQAIGTEWGILLCGQNYLTVKADIINRAKSHLDSK
ncbi:MAG TPA: hypothetical protein QF753_07820 [Victivallales bacterium]|nr:hypothetical protein [Victivallales bacterium]